jgi:subtilisin family serine protease
MYKVITLKYFVLVFIFLGNLFSAKSQTEGSLVIVLGDNIKPLKQKLYGSLPSEYKDLQPLYDKYSIDSIVPVYWFAKSEYLKRVCRVYHSSSADLVMEEIANKYSSTIQSVYMDNQQTILLHNPVDYFWTVTSPDDFLWHLRKIEANKAWDITLGDPNVKVAIIDAGHPDIRHDDIRGKVFPEYDFYTGKLFTNFNEHGTSVVSFLAAETAQEGTTAHGPLPSIGFNTRVMYSGADKALYATLYASTVLKAKIVSISWFQYCSVKGLLIEREWEEIEKEILANGTLIVRAAGNIIHSDLGGNHCNGNELYPFSGKENPDGIVVVSSTDFNDNHEIDENIVGDFNNDGVIEKVSHNHNPSVDVCAPGYNILGATVVGKGSGPNFHYQSGRGTSHSTPIVAGIAALMLSVDPCLTNYELEHLLKSTTDPIKDADKFPGLLGTGRVNAYKAVKAAQDFGKLDSPIANNTNWNNTRYLKGTVNIESGGVLSINSDIRLSKEEVVFNVLSQATLNLNPSGSFVQCDNCNDSKISFNVDGILNVNQGFFLEINRDSYIYILTNGIVNLYGDFCVEDVSNIWIWKIEEGGKLYINDVDYTWLINNTIPNNKTISSNTSGNHYAKSNIATSGNFQTEGNTLFYGGKSVTFNVGFTAKQGFTAQHGPFLDCIESDSQLDCAQKKSSSNSNEVYNDVKTIVNETEKILSFSNTSSIGDKIAVSPNPTRGELSVTLPEGSYNLQLTDVTGKIVADFGNSNQANYTLDISHLENGLYFLKISNYETQHIERVVIQK